MRSLFHLTFKKKPCCFILLVICIQYVIGQIQFISTPHCRIQLILRYNLVILNNITSYISCNYNSCCNNCLITYSHTFYNNAYCSYPNLFANYNRIRNKLIRFFYIMIMVVNEVRGPTVVSCLNCYFLLPHI